MPKNPKNFVVDNIRICKVAGLSVLQSSVVKGMVFTRSPLGLVKHVENAKVRPHPTKHPTNRRDTPDSR